jgi:hypothetical protein
MMLVRNLKCSWRLQYYCDDCEKIWRNRLFSESWKEHHSSSPAAGQFGSYDDDAADDDDEEEGHDEIDGFLKYFLSLLLVLRHPTPPSSHSATHCLHSVLLQWVTDMKIILLYPESSSSLNVSSVCSDLVST